MMKFHVFFIRCDNTRYYLVSEQISILMVVLSQIQVLYREKLTHVLRQFHWEPEFQLLFHRQ